MFSIQSMSGLMFCWVRSHSHPVKALKAITPPKLAIMINTMSRKKIICSFNQFLATHFRTCHHADLPCDLELIVGLLVQFKCGVHVYVGDQIAVGAVAEPRCEHPPQHSEALDVGLFVVRRHAPIVNAGDNGVGAALQLYARHQPIPDYREHL
jgi:hypothetical protein